MQNNNYRYYVIKFKLTITVFKIYMSESQVFQIIIFVFYVSVTIGCASVKT